MFDDDDDDDDFEVPEYHYVHGRVEDRDTLIITAVRDDIEEAQTRRMFLLIYSRGEWDKSYVDILIADIATFERDGVPTLVCLGTAGEVLRSVPGAVSRGDVDLSDDGPSDLRVLKGLTRVGDTLWCYGMRRQVYRSDLAAEDWERADEGAFVTNDSQENAGFWGLDGTSPEDLVAVGLHGDLWTRQGGLWARRSVPTDVNLSAVKTLADGRSVVAGARGVALIGRDDDWRVLENDVTKADFWSIAEHDGTVYLSGGTAGLFAVKGDAVVKVKTPKREVTDVSALDAADGTLLLVGDQRVVTFDGARWRNLDAPIYPLP